jgi:hypothetical protein
MADPAQIFRSEALHGSTTQLPSSRAAQATPRWIAWAYWALLALLAAGVVASVLIRVGSQPLIVALASGLFSAAADG